MTPVQSQSVKWPYLDSQGLVASEGAVYSEPTEYPAINITRDIFHGEWNYTIAPNQQPP